MNSASLSHGVQYFTIPVMSSSPPPHTPHTPCSGVFVMEYCGEVCTPADFEQRKKDYVKEKRRHYYFMSLKTDQVEQEHPLHTCYIVGKLLVYCW